MLHIFAGMEHLKNFLEYYPKVRQRTKNLIAVIPPELIDWSYKRGKFSIGDIIRHIAAVERFMYGETIQNKPSKYISHKKSLAPTLQDTIEYMDQLHKQSMVIFGSFSEGEIDLKCKTPTGIPITRWKWLRAMVEHEIHHRGQLYLYLNMLDIKTPPIYKLSAEELMILAKN